VARSLSNRHKKNCTNLTLEDLSAETVRRFLDHLEQARHNSVAPRYWVKARVVEIMGLDSLPDQGAPLLRISARHMLIIIHQGPGHDAGLRAQQVGSQSG